MVRRSVVLAAALACAAGACATTPRFRPRTPLGASNDELTATVEGLDNRYEDVGLVFATRVSAPADVAVRGATLTNPDKAKPCEGTRHPASALVIDGGASWQRPVPVAGEHALRLDFPATIGLGAAGEGPLSLDLETERAGVPGCLRVPIQSAGDDATWWAASPWMMGFHLLESSSFAVGARGGRWLGALAVVGVEGQVSASHGTALAFADARVTDGFGVEASYAARWPLPGTAGHEVQHGPRLGVILGGGRSPRFARIVFSGFLLDVGHWWASGAEPASTQIGLGLLASWNPTAL